MDICSRDFWDEVVSTEEVVDCQKNPSYYSGRVFSRMRGGKVHAHSRPGATALAHAH